MEMWIEGRDEKSVVFKSLLETTLEKSAIYLLRSAFIVHHHCLGRRIIQRSLLQSSRDNLCPSSTVRGTEADFQKLSPKSEEKCSTLMKDERVLKMAEFLGFFVLNRSSLAALPTLPFIVFFEP